MKILFTILLLAFSLSACANNAKSKKPIDGWVQSDSSYIPSGFTPKPGDAVWVRVFDASGQELVFEKRGLTENNLGTWKSEMAAQLNTPAVSRYIRLQDPALLEKGEPIAPASDKVWLADASYIYQMGYGN
jgi:N-acetylglucosamine binding protein domain 2